MSFDVELTRDQALELIKDTCPKCKEGAIPVFKSKYDARVWEHRKQAMGNTSISVCLATHLRDKYEAVLNG